MKKLIAAVLYFYAVFFGSLYADVDISGRVKLFSSAFLNQNLEGKYFSHNSGEFATKRLETRLQLGGTLSDHVSYSVRFDGFSSPDAVLTTRSFPESSSLGAPVRSEPFDFFLHEGYIKISNFLFNGLDLTAGKQRIQWGTADRVNVVDNLNPVDFANFLTFDPDYFGERRPQTALNLEYCFSQFNKIQFVWLLSRQHSPLPSGFTNLVAGEISFPLVHIEEERLLMKNTNYGLRFSTILFNTDIGLSFYRGNFHLPVLYGVFPLATGGLEQFFKYPKKDVFGLDLSGEISSVGFWAEGAYVRPEKLNAFIFSPVLVENQILFARKDFSLFESGYFQYVIGIDYTLSVGNGIYLNAQYLHGLFDETDYSGQAEEYMGFRRGSFFGELNDYIIVRTEYKMLREDLKIGLGGIMEISDDALAFAFMPELEYKIKDAVLLEIGAFFADGDKVKTKFGMFKDDKVIFFALKLNF